MPWCFSAYGQIAQQLSGQSYSTSVRTGAAFDLTL